MWDSLIIKLFTAQEISLKSKELHNVRCRSLKVYSADIYEQAVGRLYFPNYCKFFQNIMGSLIYKEIWTKKYIDKEIQKVTRYEVQKSISYKKKIVF